MFRAAAATPLLGALALASGINTRAVATAAQSSASSPRSASPRSSDGEPTEAEVRALCSSCHLFAPADVLPRGAWRQEIARMALIRANLPQPAGPASTAGRLIALPPRLRARASLLRGACAREIAGRHEMARRHRRRVPQAIDEPSWATEPARGLPRPPGGPRRPTTNSNCSPPTCDRGSSQSRGPRLVRH
jgi:hypothetical protein